ncbi:uncharacterized protein Z520_02584 [Fonsecaea multimorphosa CBS 102226]|uniref:Uncharacterized protein n=1 Tax=Fonsecaea multimorphosa CBS 102226 TaxID=1442371 RepID=A0A0D2KG93_9EURO|nr:uncharacterized protein Z520_02584 [Fonsecaea multimorphosa CBS 102226]KIY02445.1 hypothetical protein Z520_02584 [Fonsecaea multimorphosa CBS 102226]OAL29085.1 hypothetical protein AYO22_02522 [Fonsecaea multimorphosa]
MAPRNRQADSESASRSPSPSDSMESVLSSSSTLISSAPDSSSPPPSPSSTAAIPSSMYSSLGTRPRRLTPPSRLLGAIDEHSSTIQPDLPLSSDSEKNPVAKLHVYAAVVNAKHKPTLAPMASPPASEFDRVTGPRGERFADLRMNRKMDGAKGWKRFMCFGNILPKSRGMAYLLIAAGALIQQKLQERKELQREKKRLAYEERYRDLEQEHATRIASYEQHLPTESNVGHVETRHEVSAILSGDGRRRNTMKEGGRRRSEDSPAQWVDGVVKLSAN